ncbi:unnamed protein product, partial [Staurois parvus]
MVGKSHPCFQGYRTEPTQHKSGSMAAPQKTLCPDLLGNERPVCTLAADPWHTPSESDSHILCLLSLAETSTQPPQDASFTTTSQDGFPAATSGQDWPWCNVRAPGMTR